MTELVSLLDLNSADHPQERSSSQDNRKELGLYLRRRRESLDPVRLGVLHSGRRRTPGLRREEVAMLAEVSTTWYTWLEQGRKVNASSITLAAIAKALQCSDVETTHLFALAGLSKEANYQRECQKLSHTNQMILDQLNPMPAVVQNARFDILGFNQAFNRLMGVDLAALPDDQRNSLYLAFTNDEWQRRMDDKETVLSCLAGAFRTAMVKHVNEKNWQERLNMMQVSSSDFNRLWDQYEILEIENHTKKFHIPRIGLMTFNQVNLWSAPKDGERLVIYVPDDHATKQGLACLAEH